MSELAFIEVAYITVCILTKLDGHFQLKSLFCLKNLYATCLPVLHAVLMA